MTLSFPETDTHFPREDGYQQRIIDRALPYCRKRDLAVDVGAHVGLLTRKMLKVGFRHVVAFEPQPENYKCLMQNTDPNRVTAHCRAVSDKPGSIYMHNPAPDNSGAWEMRGEPTTVGNFSVTLDSMDLVPDLIKYDIQGHELKALDGSMKTLVDHKPVVIVECWRGGARDPVPRFFMEDLGATCVEEVGKDLIFRWRN